MLGYLSLSRSLLNTRAHASSRYAGLCAGLVCAAALACGGQLVAFFPRAVVGGLLFYLGLNLLVEWIYASWFKFARVNYLLVLFILAVIAFRGFLVGLAAGVVIACPLFAYSHSQQGAINQAFTGLAYRSKVDCPAPFMPGARPLLAGREG
jgi:SulP family sulfate permease